MCGKNMHHPNSSEMLHLYKYKDALHPSDSNTVINVLNTPESVSNNSVNIAFLKKGMHPSNDDNQSDDPRSDNKIKDAYILNINTNQKSSDVSFDINKNDNGMASSYTASPISSCINLSKGVGFVDDTSHLSCKDNKSSIQYYNNNIDTDISLNVYFTLRMMRYRAFLNWYNGPRQRVCSRLSIIVLLCLSSLFVIVTHNCICYPLQPNKLFMILYWVSCILTCIFFLFLNTTMFLINWIYYFFFIFDAISLFSLIFVFIERSITFEDFFSGALFFLRNPEPSIKSDLASFKFLQYNAYIFETVNIVIISFGLLYGYGLSPIARYYILKSSFFIRNWIVKQTKIKLFVPALHVITKQKYHRLFEDNNDEKCNSSNSREYNQLDLTFESANTVYNCPNNNRNLNSDQNLLRSNVDPSLSDQPLFLSNGIQIEYTSAPSYFCILNDWISSCFYRSNKKVKCDAVLDYNRGCFPLTHKNKARQIFNLAESDNIVWNAAYIGQVNGNGFPNGFGRWIDNTNNYGEHLVGYWSSGVPSGPYKSVELTTGSGFMCIKIGWVHYSNIDDKLSFGVANVESSVSGKFYRCFPRVAIIKPPECIKKKKDLLSSLKIKTYSYIFDNYKKKKGAHATSQKLTKNLETKSKFKSRKKKFKPTSNKKDRTQVQTEYPNSLLTVDDPINCKSSIQMEVNENTDINKKDNNSRNNLLNPNKKFTSDRNNEEFHASKQFLKYFDEAFKAMNESGDEAFKTMNESGDEEFKIMNESGSNVNTSILEKPSSNSKANELQLKTYQQHKKKCKQKEKKNHYNDKQNLKENINSENKRRANKFSKYHIVASSIAATEKAKIALQKLKKRRRTNTYNMDKCRKNIAWCLSELCPHTPNFGIQRHSELILSVDNERGFYISGFQPIDSMNNRNSYHNDLSSPNMCIDLSSNADDDISLNVASYSGEYNTFGRRRNSDFYTNDDQAYDKRYLYINKKNNTNHEKVSTMKASSIPQSLKYDNSKLSVNDPHYGQTERKTGFDLEDNKMNVLSYDIKGASTESKIELENDETLTSNNYTPFYSKPNIYTGLNKEELSDILISVAFRPVFNINEISETTRVDKDYNSAKDIDEDISLDCIANKDDNSSIFNCHKIDDNTKSDFFVTVPQLQPRGWLPLDAYKSPEILIYIHGLNNSLTESLQILGQMAAFGNYPHYLHLFIFSWPAGHSVFQFFQVIKNSENIKVQVAFFNFLRNLRDNGVRQIHILCHSIGSRLFIKSFKFLAHKLFNEVEGLSNRSIHGNQNSRKLNLITVTFLNPEYFLEDFIQEDYDLLRKFCTHITIYADGKDRALGWSEFFSSKRSLGRSVYGFWKPVMNDEITDKTSLFTSLPREMSYIQNLSLRQYNFRKDSSTPNIQSLIKRNTYIQWLDLDIIDTTFMDNNINFIRHSFWNINRELIEDIREILVSRKRARQRIGRLDRRFGNIWVYRVAPSFLTSLFETNL